MVVFDKGYDFGFRGSTTHPNHGYSYQGIDIPSFGKVLEMCVRLHQHVLDLELLSWDVAIDGNAEPVVIEVNIHRQDVNITQICNGPVFNPYIDTVLARHPWMVIPGIGAIDRRPDLAPKSEKH